MAEDRNSFLKNWSARKLKGNYTLLAMVPQVPPFIYVENNRVVSKIGNLASFQSAIPPSIDLRVRPYNGYNLGTMSANGSYNGNLLNVKTIEFWPIDCIKINSSIRSIRTKNCNGFF